MGMSCYRGKYVGVTIVISVNEKLKVWRGWNGHMLTNSVKSAVQKKCGKLIFSVFVYQLVLYFSDPCERWAALTVIGWDVIYVNHGKCSLWSMNSVLLIRQSDLFRSLGLHLARGPLVWQLWFRASLLCTVTCCGAEIYVFTSISSA